MDKPRLHAVGDVHGDLERLGELLRGAGLIDEGAEWSGGGSRLVFTGDLTDRGDAGMETIRFVMGLQEEAEAAGGRVESLMGNHDALILARAFERRGERADPDCRDLFVMNGGKEREARELAEDDAAFAWMQARPLMLLVGATLFQHADSAAYYASLGDGVETVNEAGARLAGTARGAWRIFYEMTDGREWDRERLWDDRRVSAAFEGHLARFGAERVVHGHTRHLGEGPQLRFGGRAINVDGTMSAGYRRTPGRGFVADLRVL